MLATRRHVEAVSSPHGWRNLACPAPQAPPCPKGKRPEGAWHPPSAAHPTGRPQQAKAFLEGILVPRTALDPEAAGGSALLLRPALRPGMGSTWTLQPTPTLCITCPEIHLGRHQTAPQQWLQMRKQAQSEAGQTGSSPVSLWDASSWRH